MELGLPANLHGRINRSKQATVKRFFMLKAIKPYQGIKRGDTGKGKGGTFALTTFNFGTT